MPADHATGFHLSPQQRRLWLLRQGDGCDPYRAQATFLLSGPLDRPLLRRAVERVVERHEILRTSFRRFPGTSLPRQVVDAAAIDWGADRDLRLLPPGDRQAAIAAGERAHSPEPFDDERGARLRASLLALSPDAHLLFVELPALCADTETLDLLGSEIAAAYAGDGRRESPGAEEPEGPPQYGDLADWQNELLAAPEAEAGRVYWQRQQWPAPRGAMLPGEREPTLPAVPFLPAAVRVAHDPTAVSLERLAGEAGTQLSTVLLALWQVFLWRLLGGEQPIVGTAFPGRRYPEVESACGPLIRYLPVTARLLPALRLPSLLAGLDVLLRQHAKWQECCDGWHGGDQAAAGGKTDAAFSFTFAFDQDRPAPPAGELAVTVLRKRVCSERFKLALAARRGAAGLELRLLYDRGLFPRAEARRLAARFGVLLRSAAAAPATPLGDLELLTGPERHRLLVEINDTARPFTAPACLGDLFAEQAARTPDRVAVACGAQRLTYRELQLRAHELAARLARAGAGRGTLVGICAERSAELVAAILAALETGAAYLPLDPGSPPERLAGILEDARPAVVIVERGGAALLPHGQPTLPIDAPAPEENPAAIDRPRPPVSPDDLAYVIYTSGSTGRPKGVMIPHRAIANRLLWMQRAFPLGAGDRVLFKTPFVFDASVWEIFSPLLAGACLVIARPGGHRDAAYLVDEVEASGITVLQLVPSMLRVLLERPDLDRCGCLERLFAGGEALGSDVVERCRARLGASLHNLYGPTEVAIDATSWSCPPGAVDGAVPIGRPLDNVQVYLLDALLQPVVTGAPGELFVGGAGLALGYLGRPELSADRFLPDHLGGRRGERLYRSGDLARHRPDGALEFLGRIDRQVKLRGFRIEPGEIEAALRQLPAVLDAVVVAHAAGQQDCRLVAYVVPALVDESARPAPAAGSGPAAISAPALRRGLADRLPEHMIPAAFVILDRLPLTPGGKLDRGALPAAEAAISGRRPAAAEESPRNLTEEVVAGACAEVLGVARVGVHDNFFQLGGHSLSATQLVSRLRLAFGVELPLRALFDHPTVAGMAERLDAARRTERGLEAPPIVPVPRDAELPLSFAQQRLWVIDQFEPGSAAYNIASAARLSGPLALPALAGALTEIVRRHEALRTAFPTVKGRPVQAIAAAAPVALPLIDLERPRRGPGEAEARRLALEEARLPFDLARGPLLRTILLRLAAAEHIVLLTIHHIVADGWSTGVFLRELARLYSAFSAGRPSPLPPLPVQYADYAHWQRRWLQGEVLAAQLAYWTEQLAGVSPLELPADRPRPPLQSFRGAVAPLALSPRVSDGLRRLAAGAGATLFMAALAGFQALLRRYSGQRDIVVGCPFANRNCVEVEQLIGCFVNVLVLRTNLAGGPGFGDLLARVREVSLAASAHQDLPFEQLVEALKPERDLSRNALFQVAFLLHTPLFGAVELPELTLAAIGVEIGTAKFDLTLELVDTPQGLQGSIDYNLDLFDHTTIVRLGAHLENLLAAAVAAPERPIAELGLVSEAERHQLVIEWNDTARQVERGRLIQQLFERQAKRSPNATAVLSSGGILSYRELNQRANRLARHLRDLGIGPGTLVAVFLPRDAEMIAALLAILKAGAAYVPFDGHFPAARMRWILSSLGIPCLLAKRAGLDALAEAIGGLPGLAHLVLLDAGEPPPAAGEPAAVPGFAGTIWGAETFAALPAEDLPAAGQASDLAYVIFTSGSTGAPKGVAVRHHPVVNLIEWVGESFAMGAADRGLFVTSLTFDLSVYDVFGLLAAGGSIRVAAEDELREPAVLARLLREEPITFWDSAPAMLQQLAPELAAAGRAAGSPLRLVFLSGDWIPLTLPGQVVAAFPAARVIGLGGATEATVWSNYFPILDIDRSWTSVPYGRPIWNARYHVLDEQLEPCPIGIPGDLYIAGECLSSGYAGEPGLTAAQFVPAPFAAPPDGLLYLTGDRARYRPDGNLEFLGRSDHQVKIRGFRIELGEVEAALRDFPAVREAVAIAREDSPGNRRLVAYLLPEREIDLEDLRRALRRRLPDYMIPAAFVVLPELPVTANGKLDRAALPAPDRGQAAERKSFIPPRTDTEAALAEIWREVLAVERVGAEDNFFELGGHSLTAAQVISRIRFVCGVELLLRDLFEAETLATLAERMDASALAVAAPAEVASLLEQLAHLSEDEAERLLTSGETLAGGASRSGPQELPPGGGR